MLKRFDQCSSDLPMPDVLGLTLHGDSEDICALRDHLVALGAAGIGLTLLAATTTVEPEWDRMMLVDLPEQCNSIL